MCLAGTPRSAPESLHQGDARNHVGDGAGFIRTDVGLVHGVQVAGAGALGAGDAAFAYTSPVLGGLIGGWFALRLDPLFTLLMAVGAAAVLFYSDVFARAGIGELAAGLGLGALPVWGAAWVQGPPPGPAALWAGVPAFF